MKFIPNDPPREFTVGKSVAITLYDCGRVELDSDEQVTFTTSAGGEYDVVRKEWGFYATPSLNGRLPKFGLRPVLVRSPGGLFYVWLVEQGKVDAFRHYLEREEHRVIAWLDEEHALSQMDVTSQRQGWHNAGDSADAQAALTCPMCTNPMTQVHAYESQPQGETRFPISDAAGYHRTLHRCRVCGHFVSVTEMDLSSLYSADYVAATYKDAAGIRKTFDRIINLPQGKSDNRARAERVDAFARAHLALHGSADAQPKLLDVGSGLCVFPHEMKKRGWHCTALDPDARTTEHARKVVGVEAIQADFFDVSPDQKFDLITFNKVLEHVADPVAMLEKAKKMLAPGGLIYIELPDGQAAFDGEGPLREEFFIEHLHVFSASSLSLLADHANLNLLALERLREPSTKYTLRGFAALAEKSAMHGAI